MGVEIKEQKVLIKWMGPGETALQVERNEPKRPLKPGDTVEVKYSLANYLVNYYQGMYVEVKAAQEVESAEVKKAKK